MRFSEQFAITRTLKDDWYDPHLTVDTKLFLDPLLLLKKGTDSRWRSAHDELIAHFVHCYNLVAQSEGPGTAPAKRAERLLTFPEPAEFCLGYTSTGTRGSGGGSGVAKQLVGAIAVALAAGLDDPSHIEELGILNAGIGADRISDAVCNVLKGRFIRYTQAVAERHAVPLEEHRVRNAECYLTEGRWMPDSVMLPTNPTNGKPVLLVPERFLNDLPVLNADDWFDSHLNQDVREEMNLKVGDRVRKEDIVRWARQHPDRVRTWSEEEANREILKGYDFTSDPLGIVRWDTMTKTFAIAHPIGGISKVETQDDLRLLLTEVLKMFKHYVEKQRGCEMLWDTTGKEKHEEAAQLLFLGLAQQYLRQFGVELDREVELGRGPVDFKLSMGTPVRLILEMKKSHNGKFWNGLEHQLRSYLESDKCEEGWFVALRYRSTPDSSKKIAALPRRVTALSAELDKEIRFLVIDARPKKSASNLKKGDE